MIKRNKSFVLLAFFVCYLFIFAFFNIVTNNIVIAKNKEFISSATSMAVMERSSKRLLFSKNEKQKLPMASTTKIITAIYVIEKIDNLDKIYCVPKEATKIPGTSIGLMENEHLTIRELLYGLMLRSGNDCAVALAIASCGSVEKFVENANNFVKQIGAFDTHLENPHGLPDDNHYTTAYDLALISAYANENQIFREIVSTKEKEISNELKSKYNRKLKNKNKLLKSFEGADGVKTGFTLKAGRCFVGSATRNNMQLICVLLNCKPMFEECQILLEKGFNEYKMCQLIESGKVYKTVKVLDADIKQIDLLANKDFFYPLSKSEIKNIKVSVKSENYLKAPINKDFLLGQIDITLENQLIFSHKIYNINNIRNNTLFNQIEKIVDEM